MKLTLGLAAALTLAATQVFAAAAPPVRPDYGPPIGLQDAKGLVAAAEAAARAMNLNMAVAVVEPTGDLVILHKMDNTQYASPELAIEKARTAARFRRPSKEFEDNVAGGRNAILALPGALPIEGGVLILRGGKLIGALGASGGTSAQDGQVAAAALAALR